MIQEINQLAQELEAIYARIKALPLPRRSFKPHQRSWEIGGTLKAPAASNVKRAVNDLLRLEILLREREQREKDAGAV